MHISTGKPQCMRADGSVNVPEFLNAAADFCNGQVFGTLSCSMSIHPSTTRIHHRSFENFLGDLKYGSIVVNGSTGLGFGFCTLPWGAWAAAGMKTTFYCCPCLAHFLFGKRYGMAHQTIHIILFFCHQCPSSQPYIATPSNRSCVYPKRDRTLTLKHAAASMIVSGTILLSGRYLLKDEYLYRDT